MRVKKRPEVEGREGKKILNHRIMTLTTTEAVLRALETTKRKRISAGQEES
jgi:hypothetical protein